MLNRPVAPIYLDYQATTPTDPRVVDAMLPWFTEHFGNPHSADHRHGWDAAEAVDKARDQVAAAIGAKGKEIIFTSGATESNNLAIKGVARARRKRDGRDKVVTLATEHKCVLESANRLIEEGFEVIVLPVKPDGLVDLDLLNETLDDRTALVSVMAANNEIGVIQPLAEIGRMARAKGVLFHSDCAQAVGKIPLGVEALNLDLVSISGHKLYGPKGVGALYVRRRPRVPIEALMDGGGQEKGLRSGTLAPPLCVGFGQACRIALAEMASESERLSAMRDDFLTRVEAAVPQVVVNGSRDCRLAANLNLTFPGMEGAELLAALDGLSVSSGSACSSGSGSYSHVLEAIGQPPGRVAASIRVAFGRFTTDEEASSAAQILIDAVERCARVRA
ncbi:cysteine desulfurase family protein [Aestuariispira ectoiniformans]|uniref:cysteine desulfurase family protein n=1 Tax=Aestuariispira ectoiniformans TaxID=2775080 RepID=UPI00223B1ABD|nr:cysteine desulfurase family protein [Aestuariispira ectoiniformans]